MNTLVAAFEEAYGRAPQGVWRAPGRVNLIGEHTDYNDGLVLPFALAQGVSVAAARRDDGVLELRSLQAAADGRSLPIDGLAPGTVDGWAAYPAGVAWVLREHGAGGASLLVDSDLPQGAGLASSAALECATALALCDLYGLEIERAELARRARRAEAEFAGVPCGIMDQSAALLCTAGHALLLDCRSGLSGQVPLRLGEDLSLLVVDTRAAHALTGGEYARRRAECEQAAALLGLDSLRDVTDLASTLERLPAVQSRPSLPFRRRSGQTGPDPATLRRRVQHVVTENHRVEATVGLLRADALAEIGGMLTASHLSLRDQFEVSWPQADATVEAALRAGARGGRMVGGGFGGSVLVLTATDRATHVREAIDAAYQARGWPAPHYQDAVPSQGAHRIL
ncbi:galactokinase [Thermomonospora echinospora]|uniref:Galactokinase n=1 Tax=Thermomonospora echinospora TaxID=1992 RepID=A0A1H5ZHG9_9ACTN|nr:galactokinase [Thermomonospora echinospora]SEG35185.1 galactokinase [Thermomonospora echinospora]